jgi:erythromycin esterase
MIRWMRAHNSAGGSVGFYGFDLQYPGMAIDNVRRFVGTVDPRATADFEQHLGCLATYANDAHGQFPYGWSGYAGQNPAQRESCLNDLYWVETTLVARRDPYAALTSEADWARAAHSARVAIQYERMASNRESRDSAMAENARWLLDQLGPQGKIVLWAHNAHVGAYDGAMGSLLRQRLGSQLFVMGFDFARGSFSGVRMSGSTWQTFSRGDSRWQARKRRRRFGSRRFTPDRARS